jgi:hypothetical protein
MQAQLSNITKKFNPPIIAIAGDLVDALNDTVTISFHRQYEVNWQRYNSTRVFTRLFDENRTIIELAGNHDMMVVAADNETRNRYRYYTMHPGEPFAVRSIDFSDDFSVPVRLIEYNPLRAPFTSGPVGMYPCHAIDDVEKLDLAISDGFRNVIISHFRLNEVWSVGWTASGRGIREVVRRSHLYLSGHLHPPDNEYLRMSDTLAVCVTAFFESPNFVMAFIDNGGVGGQTVDTHAERVVVITYPISKIQLTGRHVFNLRSFPVRAVSFTDLPISLNVYIDGGLVGQAAHAGTLRRNVQWYSLDVTVSGGDHTLKVGDHEIAFFVGDAVPATTEYANLQHTPEPCVYPAFGVFLHFLFHVVPWWKLMEEALDNFRAYMYGESGAIPLEWYEQLLIGPLYQFSRIRRGSCFQYWFSWLLGLVFLVCPMYTMYVDEFMATGWVWGIELEDTFAHYAMLGVLFIIFEFMYVVVMVNVLGLWNEREDPFEWWQYIECGAMVLTMAVGYIGWGVLAYLAGSWWTLFTAPAMLTMLAGFVVLYFNLKGEFGKKFAPVGYRRVSLGDVRE